MQELWGGKWYLRFGTWTGNVKSAQLVTTANTGKGVELLQGEYPLEFWQKTGLNGLRSAPSSDKQNEKVVKERVVVREIIKIRCLIAANSMMNLMTSALIAEDIDSRICRALERLNRLTMQTWFLGKQ